MNLNIINNKYIMTIRSKTKIFIFAVLLVFIISVSLYSSSNVKFETRATWLWGSSIDSNEKINRNIKKILKANLNTVFIMIPKTFYGHGYGKEKLFASFLKLAYRNGISLHAWFANGRRLGRKNQINFSDKNEQQNQVLWVSHFLNRYSKYLDGIHLDHIRIKKGVPVNSDAIKGITDTISGIRKFMKKNYPEKFLTTTIFSVSPVFIRPYNTPFVWNQDVPSWHKDWIKHNPNSWYRVKKRGQIIIGTPYFLIYQQDPIFWIKQGLVDAIISMQYTTLDKKWRDEFTQFHSFFKYAGIKDRHLLMGLGWVPKRNEKSTRGYNAPGIVRKIKEGRRNSLKGFSIFILSNHGHDDSQLIKALTIPSETNDFNPPFSKRAISLISRYNKTKKE